MDKTLEHPKFLGDLVAQNSAKLTEADARLLDILMRDPIRAAMNNGKEVSLLAGVHPASAVRLARRLGFSGYPEFRSYLQSNLVRGHGEDFDNPAARIAARLVRAEEGELLSTILDSEIAALEQLRNSVCDADIRAFSESLRDARRIFIMGRSHATSLSALIALRLRRSGYDAVDLAAAQGQFAETAMTMREDDVVWLLSFRKPATVMVDLRCIAAEKGATTLLLADPHGARINPAPDHQIAVSRGGAGQSQSLVVPMTIANTIILDLAAIDNGRSMQALEAFRTFRDSLPARLDR